VEASEEQGAEKNEDWFAGPRKLLGVCTVGQAFLWSFSTPQRARLSTRQ